MIVLRRYVTQNPMRVEAKRAFRKFLGMGKVSRNAVRGGSVALGIVYVTLLGLLLYVVRDISPEAAIYVELTVLLFSSAIGNYSAISSEREKRTWDVLRSGPITSEQILLGKFLGGAAVTGAMWLAFQPFNIVNSLLYTQWGSGSPVTLALISQNAFHTHRVLQFLLYDLLLLVCPLFVLAVALMISARSKRSMQAMCVALGFVFFWVAILPALLSSLVQGRDQTDSVMKFSGNPYMLVGRVAALNDPQNTTAYVSQFVTPAGVAGTTLFFVAIFAALIIGVLGWTGQNLNID
jgi:ABC-type transport system involved in multi-copper enzyme maturation permease subunit